LPVHERVRGALARVEARASCDARSVKRACPLVDIDADARAHPRAMDRDRRSRER